MRFAFIVGDYCPAPSSKLSASLFFARGKGRGVAHLWINNNKDAREMELKGYKVVEGISREGIFIRNSSIKLKYFAGIVSNFRFRRLILYLYLTIYE